MGRSQARRVTPAAVSVELPDTMPFDITATRTFAAAHQLRLYDGSLEPLHGHNWVVKVTVSAAQLDAIGVVMDFHELERLLDAIVTPMHNTHLNDLPAFRSLNPSTEHVALHVARSLNLPNGVRLVSVEVWETPQNSAVYRR
jgi:6-pyruvoyltetrahydropterin/6-carboxytetrahydropterin synthase